MAEIQVFDSTFKTASGTLETTISLTEKDVHVPVVHQVVKAILAGRRQGTACTKNRAMVSGGGAKPFKQKGTGRARQGSSRSPLMPGGGVAFGPTPRDFSQKVNKKVMKKAIQSVLADRLAEKKLKVLEKIEVSGKTKEAFQLLKSNDLLPALIVVNDTNETALQAFRNIKNVNVMPVKSFNVYEAVKYENLIIEKEALEELLQRLG